MRPRWRAASSAFASCICCCSATIDAAFSRSEVWRRSATGASGAPGLMRIAGSVDGLVAGCVAAASVLALAFLFNRSIRRCCCSGVSCPSAGGSMDVIKSTAIRTADPTDPNTPPPISRFMPHPNSFHSRSRESPHWHRRLALTTANVANSLRHRAVFHATSTKASDQTISPYGSAVVCGRLRP